MGVNLGRVAALLMDTARWNSQLSLCFSTFSFQQFGSLDSQVFFTGAERADEPGGVKPKLQGLSVQVLYDHGGM